MNGKIIDNYRYRPIGIDIPQLGKTIIAIGRKGVGAKRGGAW
jgi:hypothetical protein